MPRATRVGVPSIRSNVTAIEGTSFTARTTAKAIRCVYETFSGRPAAWIAWLSCRRRWSSRSTRTVRKLVAVGTSRLSSMYLTRAAAAPRSGIDPVGDWAGDGGVGACCVAAFCVAAFCVAVCCRSMASATSRRRIDPPGPLPLTVAKSMPFARASSSAPSVISTLAAAWPPFGAGGAGAVDFPSPLGGEGAGAVVFPPPLAGEGRVGALSPSAPTSISASGAPTEIVWPASARIFSSLPLAGAGISASTLSVVTSTSASPSRTESPGCFSHLATVPSVTDSPISGRVTCMVDWGTTRFYPLNLAANMSFKAKLRASEDVTGSLLCLGLDPEPDLLPPSVERSPAGIAVFVRTIVEAVGDSVSSYKLNLAFYERWGREASWLLDQALTALPKDRPVILDAKRGDVG